MARVRRRHRQCLTLLAYREAACLSQTRAAQLVETSQASWARIEKGEQTPSPQLAQRIARVTGISVLQLLGLDEEARRAS